MAMSPSLSHVSIRLEALTAVILLSCSVCMSQPWESNISSFNSFGNTFNNLQSDKPTFFASEFVQSSSTARAASTSQAAAAAEKLTNDDQARFIRRANNAAPPGNNPPKKEPNVGAIQEEPAPPPPPPPSEPSNSFVCNPGKGRSISTRSEEMFRKDIERRLYPFCVGSKTLNEYRSNLPGYTLVEDILKFKNSRLQKVPIFVTNKPSDGYKNVRKVEYSILKLETQSNFRVFDPEFVELAQWIHIKITTNKPTTVLIVQANVLPYAMPYGNFDLEKACMDCFGGSSLRNQFGDINNYNEELAFKDLRAAVLPCYRRTHLHTTHPNIYVYASKKATKEFHFHYKFYDMVCRETKFIQFMIANQQASGELQAFYTAVIDHESIHHTLDGQPYPMHPDLYFNCHQKEQRIIFSVPLGGNWFIGLFYDYEKCLLESEDHCEKYLEKKGYGYQSDYVCNIRTIKRTTCPFDKRVGIGGEKWNDCERFKSAVNSFEQCGHSGRVCGLCDMEQNPWHDELFRRLIRSSYRARRIHGILMIWALIGLSNISVHIARYFKETGGGIGILVGCWMWAHLGCSLFSVFFMWLAVGIVQLLPQRGYHIHPQFIPYQFPNNGTKYKEKRDAVISLHFVIGTITFFVFHFVLIFGAVRPIGGRFLAILSHAAVGYLTLVLGVLSTWVSTACHETKLWALLLFLIGIGPWLVSMIIQLKMDRETKSDRSYFPVVEAVKLVRPTPYAHSRFAILGLLTFLTYVVLVIIAVKSSYFGLLHYEPCSNCPYKYDEIVLHTESDLVASAVFMIDSYECTDKDFPGIFE